MVNAERRGEIHDLDVTVWVGKAGIDAVADELDGQLDDRGTVKVKFLRAARGGADVADLAAALADRVGADLIETRGHTAVVAR